MAERRTTMIEATFRDGRKGTYTHAVLNLMYGDTDIKEVVDLETGEVLIYREEGDERCSE